jgi:iron complex transport system substrate-binding protein
MKKKVVSVVLALSMMAGVASCGSQTGASDETTDAAATTTTTTTTVAEATEESSEETSSEEASDSLYPLTYEDAYGNVVTIESEPETVVSVSPALTEIVYALGAEDKLIGRTDYCDYPEEVFDIPSVGAIDNPDIEIIAELEPDVVIASSIFSEEAYNSITELGIPVVIIRDETTLEGMFDVVADVADVIGCHDEGEALVEELSSELDEIRANAPETDVTVYYCMSYGEYGDYTAGGDTFIGDIIESAGAVNAAADVSGWSFSAEALVEADPDYILIDEWNYDGFISTEPYSSLTAVQEGNVIVIDPNLLNRQGPRNLEAVELIQEYISGDADTAAADEAA